MRGPVSTRALAALTVAAALLILSSSPALAVDFYLRVDEVTVTMPDTTMVPMWGFALDTDGNFGTIENPAQVPGPRLEVPVGDTTVNITIFNALDVNQPVSIMIAGQVQTLNPVRFAAGDPDYPDRIRSFTQETAQGATQLYTWTNFRPGTFLYKSGTQPQVQVQMGLYGAITADFAAGQVYDGVPYVNEAVLLYSEIDPALHTAVTTPGGYGPTGTLMTSTLDYNPKYFLINGQPWAAAAPIEISGLTVGEATLLRFLSASLDNHVPTLIGDHWSLVAEDAFPLPHPLTQVTAAMPAGKTLDVLFTPTLTGTYPVIDRRLALTNAAATEGGMLAKLVVAGVAGAPFGVADAYAVNEDSSLTVDGTTLAAVIANDSDGGAPGVDPLTATLYQDVLHGTLALAADGTFTYTPTANFSGADFFLYTVSDGLSSSEPVAAVIRVDPLNDAPQTVADAYATFEDVPLVLSAPGVLANDIDIDGDVLSATQISGPANGSLTLLSSGAVTYTPVANWFGIDSFQYEASDASLSGGTVTVTIDVSSVNDLPVSVADSFGPVYVDTLFTVPAPGVLGNDSDIELDPLTAVLVKSTTNGALTLNADGSFSYQPNPGYIGPDSFRYKANDGTANSLEVAVSLDVVQLTIFADGFESGNTSAWSAAFP